MALLEWDKTGEHFYETGVKNGVLYPYDKNNTTKPYSPGVAWNGLTSVSETPSGADENAIYADNIKYLSLRGAEEFGATIEAYTYPDEWAACDGSAMPVTGLIIGQQSRKMFGFCYRTELGNDIDGDSYGYKLHLLYGCTASPSERSYETINDSPEAITFSWEITTIKQDIGTINDIAYKPVSVLTIDASKFITNGVKGQKLLDLEKALYGYTVPAFSATQAYAKDDVVTHESGFYKAKAAITAGTWNASDWDELSSDPGFAYLPKPAEVIEMLTAS